MDVNKLNGPELVKEYNKRSGKKPIKRFGSVEDGRKRVKALLNGQTTKPQEKGLVGEFGVRGTTNRAKLLRAFESHRLGSKVNRDELVHSLYRSKDKKHHGAFVQVINSLLIVIDKKKLGFKLTHEKDKATKEVNYVLSRK